MDNNKTFFDNVLYGYFTNLKKTNAGTGDQGAAGYINWIKYATVNPRITNAEASIMVAAFFFQANFCSCIPI